MPYILIADDNSDIRSLLRTLLERRSALVFEAVDGRDAIEQARKEKPDLIILDLCMPRMNGLEVARALRAEMMDVPIILFTMHESAVLPAQLAEAGINALVSKGDSSVLVSCIERLLRAGSKTKFAAASRAMD